MESLSGEESDFEIVPQIKSRAIRKALAAGPISGYPSTHQGPLPKKSTPEPKKEEAGPFVIRTALSRIISGETTARGPTSSSSTAARPLTAASKNFPPTPSGSGKKYYVFQHGVEQVVGQPPTIVAGSNLAVQYLGGSWEGTTLRPKGFKDLEEAVTYVHQNFAVSDVRILW